jgi:hypothetical protein
MDTLSKVKSNEGVEMPVSEVGDEFPGLMMSMQAKSILFISKLHDAIIILRIGRVISGRLSAMNVILDNYLAQFLMMAFVT